MLTRNQAIDLIRRSTDLDDPSMDRIGAPRLRDNAMEMLITFAMETENPGLLIKVLQNHKGFWKAPDDAERPFGEPPNYDDTPVGWDPGPPRVDAPEPDYTPDDHPVYIDDDRRITRDVLACLSANEHLANFIICDDSLYHTFQSQVPKVRNEILALRELGRTDISAEMVIYKLTHTDCENVVYGAYGLLENDN